MKSGLPMVQRGMAGTRGRPISIGVIQTNTSIGWDITKPKLITNFILINQLFK